VIAGWVTTEVGRQPWVVYGLMRTRDAVSPSLTGGDVLASLVIYLVAYCLIFGAGLLFMARLMKAGPAALAAEPEGPAAGRAARPLSAAREG
jgi:cytochrome d ubiquinol oxidase subunit I